jgi:hypothetical protein
MKRQEAIYHGGHGDTAKFVSVSAVSPCAPWFKQGFQHE